MKRFKRQKAQRQTAGAENCGQGCGPKRVRSMLEHVKHKGCICR